jgi:uncharacterized membrane protein SirB2
MTSFHLELRTLHIACAYVSIGLFVVRHVLNLRGVEWRKWKALIFMPHVVDTLLLASAVLLAINIHQYPFVDAWLTAKALLLAVYIVLGTIALKRGKTAAVRRAAFLGAAIVFAFILSVARTRSPSGVLSQLGLF